VSERDVTIREYEPRDRAMHLYAAWQDTFANAEQMHNLVGNIPASDWAHWAGLVCLRAYESEWTDPEPIDLDPSPDYEDTLPTVVAYLRRLAA
jgi:hypothetical protein